MNTYPSIVLRKGKTEIKIENAASIVKKVNEMCPPQDNCSWLPNVNKIKRELSDAEREKQKRWMSSAKDWFKNEMFGGLEDFEMVVNEQTSTPILEEITDFPTKFADPYVYQPPVSVPSITIPSPKEQVVQSVNKNAYELRELILENAITVVNNHAKNISLDEFVDKVLDVSQKFYTFVENKRKN